MNKLSNAQFALLDALKRPWKHAAKKHPYSIYHKKTVDSLIKEGFVERYSYELYEEKGAIRLTEAGHEYMMQHATLKTVTNKEVLDTIEKTFQTTNTLSQEEMSQLLSIAKRYQDALLGNYNIDTFFLMGNGDERPYNVEEAHDAMIETSKNAVYGEVVDTDYHKKGIQPF